MQESSELGEFSSPPSIFVPLRLMRPVLQVGETSPHLGALRSGSYTASPGDGNSSVMVGNRVIDDVVGNRVIGDLVGNRVIGAFVGLEVGCSE